MNIIDLTEKNIDNEHICCAISDKKCIDGYNLKKSWIKKEFLNGFKFRRLDARAKVFIEYGESVYAWAPVTDDTNYLLIQCLWVSGSYKEKGYGKELLSGAIEDAKKEKKDGILIIVGTKKMHFMCDTKWILKQGFETIDTTESGFSLLSYKINKDAKNPKFTDTVKNEKLKIKEGLLVYYSNRCPFTDYHINTSLKETVSKRNLTASIVKLESFEDAKSSPAPSSIFSLFYNGKFITTDISVCMDSRFDKIMSKHI